ncbi:MAG: hypothetical protein NTV48_02035 [Candidatus Vogelbacteria bacterium]|nr:hypothetical protein [Candidatus Vogelbacteria bacterium]
MDFFGLRQKRPASRRTVWNTELFRRALAEKEVNRLAIEVRRFLIERQDLTKNLVTHNNALEQLRAGIGASKVGTAERILIVSKIRKLEVSRRKINQKRDGGHLPAQIQSLVKIARGIADAPNRPALERWPEYIDSQLLSLSTPSTRRPSNWVADQITRLIDALEEQCMSKDEKNLLIAFGALARRD